MSDNYYEKIIYEPNEHDWGLVKHYNDTFHGGAKGKTELYHKLMWEEFYEFVDEIDRNEPIRANILKELSDLIYVCYGYLQSIYEDFESAKEDKVFKTTLLESYLYAKDMGADINEAFNRVHVNNCGRCTQDDGSIKRRSDGKVIKNPNFKKVDLSDL